MVYTRLIFFLFAWLAWQTLPAQNYFLNGDASFSGGNCYTITSATNWQNGTVWYANQLDLSVPFDIEFSMNFGTNDGNGADGMVFVLQTVGTSAIGASGGGMGFEGFNPSFGIEFDTFENSANNGSPEVADISADHIAFLRNGNVAHTSVNNLAGPVAASATSQNIEDGQAHTVRITWNPTNQFLHAYFDCSLRLFDTVDLVNTIFSGQNMVYFGFTGSTGGLNNNQSVCLSNQILGVSDPSPICVGESVVLEASGNPLGSYTWFPTTNLSNSTGAETIASPTTTTTYTVSYTSTCGVLTSQEIEVVVLPPYPLSISTPQSFCEEENYTIEGVNLPFPTSTLAWTTANGTLVSGATTPAPVVSAAGVYQLTASGPNFCPSTAEVQVLTLPLPSIAVGDDVEACAGEPILLQAQTNGSSVLWTPGNATGLQLTVTESGIYTAQATLGPCTASDAATVTVVNLPPIALPDSVQACSTLGATLTAASSGQWSTGASGTEVTVFTEGYVFFTVQENGCSAEDSTWVHMDQPLAFELGNNAILCAGDTLWLSTPFPVLWPNGEQSTTFSITQTASVEATSQAGTCTFTDALDVVLLPLPEVNLPDSALFCTGAATAIGTESLSGLTYTWSGGENTASISPIADGLYVLTASNACGEARDSIEVIFELCEHQVFVPNAFTPNADGVNDNWAPVYNQLSKAHTLVLDRWGTVVFESAELKPVWTGNRRGQDHFVQDGVYVYRIRYTTNFNAAGEEYGTITLLR